jgi:hypothetical protein
VVCKGGRGRPRPFKGGKYAVCLFRYLNQDIDTSVLLVRKYSHEKRKLHPVNCIRGCF